MTERKIQDELWIRLRANGHEWMMPNYTPWNWWECDMFSVTRAGFMVEHEIKLSVSDFRADAMNKYRNHFDRATKTHSKQTKHQILAGDPRHTPLRGPARFLFVVPHGLVTLDQVPEFAGLIYVTDNGPRHNYSFLTVRNAPKLHSDKCDPKIMADIGKSAYWRFWTHTCGSPRGLRDPGGPSDYDI